MALTKAHNRMIEGAAVNVKDFGAKGDGSTDDTAAFIDAMASGAGTIYLPEGTYLSDFGDPFYQPSMINSIPDGTHFEGSGEKTIWRNYNRTSTSGGFSGRVSRGAIGTDSGSSSSHSEDISFRNIKFMGWSQEDPTVDQGNSLIFLSGVKRVLFEKCFFVSPRGDAITIASGFGLGVGNERHNYDVIIRDCVFDGVNGKNRNGVSVIDCDGITIEGCTFRNFSDPTMPGSIDFEPDDNYGVIKNVVINGNKFESGTGQHGHIVFACDNIPTNNQENWTVTNNHIASATKGIYLLTEDSTPSVPPTNSQNIVIANNTITDCGEGIQKFKGSITGISIINNVLNSPTSTEGGILFSDGTSDWTLKDCIIANNTIIGNKSILLAIADDINTLAISGNIFRGATQSFMRLGITGSSTTQITVVDNIFVGTPSTAICQHDASTHNAETNIWKNNSADKTLTSTFRGLQNDFVGSQFNYKAISSNANSYPYGISQIRYQNIAIISGNDTGIVETRRLSTNSETATIQIFYPDYSATYDNDIYFRKAVDATTWGSWYNIAGV